MCGKIKTINEMLEDAKIVGTMDFAKEILEMFACGRPVDEIKKACSDTLHCGIEYFSGVNSYGDIN